MMACAIPGLSASLFPASTQTIPFSIDALQLLNSARSELSRLTMKRNELKGLQMKLQLPLKL